MHAEVAAAAALAAALASLAFKLKANLLEAGNQAACRHERHRNQAKTMWFWF
jgi:hypothetical protein